VPNLFKVWSLRFGPRLYFKLYLNGKKDECICEINYMFFRLHEYVANFLFKLLITEVNTLIITNCTFMFLC